MAGYRPNDWHVLDLEKDPTPGDPERVRSLAKNLQDFSDDVAEGLRLVKSMAGEDVLLQWAGKSAEVFAEEFDDVPKNLKKLTKSYGMAGDALADYWPKLERAQSLADKALAKGREAQSDLKSANSRLSDANSWVTRATKESDKYQKDKEKGEGDKDVPKPDEDKVRQATRNANSANDEKDAAQGDVTAANNALDAAKKMAEDARKMREDAAREAKNKLEEASDAGIQNRSWWEEIADWFADNWDKIVAVLKVVVAVLGVVAMIIGGPILGAIVLIAAAVVLADTLYKYAKGEASLLDVGLAALDMIPGMKGLTTLGGLAKGAKALGQGGLKAMAKGAGSGLKAGGRKFKDLVTCGDPVDMATGEMVMAATDVELPGMLPLVIDRSHRTRVRGGRLFGPSWASNLDQRLLLDPFGVELSTDDGMLLQYPVPERGTPVLPLEGPRWPLAWDGEAGGEMTVTQPESGRVLSFRPQTGVRPSELLLAGMRDRNDNTISVTYDDQGLPTEVAHHGGYRIGVTCEDRRVTELRLISAEDRPTLMRYAYDEHGNLAEIYESGEQPQYLFYDEEHRVTGWQDRNGGRYRYEYDFAGRCTATVGDDGFMDYRFDYDAAALTTTATNSLGHTTSYRFNDAFQLLAETDPLGHTVHRTYDRYDRQLTSTDELGATTRLEWDDAGNLVARHAPDGTVSTARYNALRLPVEETAADGACWRQDWDERGNCVAATAPDGTAVTFTHDTTGAVATATRPDGTTERFTHDAAGVTLTETDPSGAETRFGLDAFGRITDITDPLGAVTRMTWTVEGQLASRTDPSGATDTWTYDGEGNRLTHTDTTGRTTRFTYTHFGLPASRTTPDGGRFEFRHDTELRLSQVTNPQGLTWEYTLDAAGRPVAETDFDDRTVRYTHDAAGRLLSLTNPVGQTTSFAYDSMGNTTHKSLDGRTIAYTYDRAGRLTGATGPDTADLGYRYDTVGRVVEETVDGRTVTSAYDVLGRRTLRSTPAGVTTSYDYDAVGNRTALTVAGRTLASVHDRAGQETSRSLGTRGASLARTWDTSGRLTGEAVTAGSGGPAPVDRSYSYRADGNVSAITDRGGSGAARRRTFENDALGRVTGVRAEDWTETYAYDSAGNQTQAAWPDGRPEPEARGDRAYEGNRLVRAGGITYAHDAAGRVVLRRKKRLSRKADRWHYTWDAEDRLTEVVTPDGTRWRYRYDPLGRRVAKQRLADDGDTVLEETLFTWDGEDLTEQADATPGADGQVTLTWDRDGTRPVTQTQRTVSAELPQEVVDERFFAIVTDLVGTPTELVDEDGGLAWQARSTLWGLTETDDRDATGTPLRFPGQYYDAETGLHYNYFRHYDPTTALYLTNDPLGMEAGPNPRRYVLNPLLWIDYLGLLTCRQNARRLRSALRREGRGPARGQAAAHLVPSGGTQGHWAPGANSRALLGRYGVDVNEAANGIPLGHPSPHNFTHRQAFLQRLDDHLQATARTGAANGMTQQQIGDQIRRELRSIGRTVKGELATGRPGPGAVWTA